MATVGKVEGCSIRLIGGFAKSVKCPVPARSSCVPGRHHSDVKMQDFLTKAIGAEKGFCMPKYSDVEFLILIPT